jgi:hypothetical protein
MAKGKRGYLLLLPLLSLLSLPPCRRSCPPLRPRCNNCHCHSHCLHQYRCHLPHFDDCCLPPQFLLLSATTIATVPAFATADPVLAAVTTAIRPHCCRHCPCHPCTCPLCCPPALSPSPSPTSLPSPLLARHPRRHRSCRRRHHPICYMTPLLRPCFDRRHRCHLLLPPPSTTQTFPPPSLSMLPPLPQISPTSASASAGTPTTVSACAAATTTAVSVTVAAAFLLIVV